MADGGVVLVEFEKLSFLEEEDCVPEILFDFPDTFRLISSKELPVLLFKRGECFPCTGRDV